MIHFILLCPLCLGLVPLFSLPFIVTTTLWEPLIVTLFVIYLEFKFNWESCFVSDRSAPGLFSHLILNSSIDRPRGPLGAVRVGVELPRSRSSCSPNNLTKKKNFFFWDKASCPNVFLDFPRMTPLASNEFQLPLKIKLSKRKKSNQTKRTLSVNQCWTNAHT